MSANNDAFESNVSCDTDRYSEINGRVRSLWTFMVVISHPRFTPNTDDDRSTGALLYLQCTRIRRRHLIDDETYWSARYAMEIPLDGFVKQEKEIGIASE